LLPDVDLEAGIAKNRHMPVFVSCQIGIPTGSEWNRHQPEWINNVG